ncbi:MAG: transglycosylase SLT domain-containing protein [Gammaproteobacteria bacterium]|nr:transglycosylase SLT domain-containing protein [Gammaproteobacteria bacterium]
MLLCTNALAADPYSLQWAADRTSFLAARQALRDGQTARFEQLATQLRDYPLYIYLRYDQLNARLATADEAEVRAFLAEAADSPLAERLRQDRLEQLARQQQWPEFITLYNPDTLDVALQCAYLRATQRTPPTEDWLDTATDLWTVGHAQPTACDPVFDVLNASPRMTATLIWQRIRLAMDENTLSLAAFLAKSLPETERAWVSVWRTVHERPSTAATQPRLQTDGPQAREILADAARRWARSDAVAAYQWWASLHNRYAFSADQHAQTLRAIALQAAYKRLPVAHTWLAEVPESARDESVRAWQARSALLYRDWPALIDTIDAMPQDEAKEGEWRYWWAQAQIALGNGTAAQPVLRALATERSYHGFLAADALRMSYSLKHRPITATDVELAELQRQHPALLRAGELLRAQLIYDARREWTFGTRALSPRDLERAALLAHRWNWHDRAIFTAGKSGHLDDLELRFPVLHAQDVQRVAAPLQIDPAWVMGVMRQESAFIVDVRSAAGALGLMQLMPGTGADMARLLKLPKPDSVDLLQAGTNIRLGSQYLKQTLDSLGNKVLATAAYNAGPGRVRRWLPQAQPMPTPLWVDTIPFSETRGYVRNVLAFATIYDARLQRPITPLHTRMPANIAPR